MSDDRDNGRDERAKRRRSSRVEGHSADKHGRPGQGTDPTPQGGSDGEDDRRDGFDPQTTQHAADKYGRPDSPTEGAGGEGR